MNANEQEARDIIGKHYNLDANELTAEEFFTHLKNIPLNNLTALEYRIVTLHRLNLNKGE